MQKNVKAAATVVQNEGLIIPFTCLEKEAPTKREWSQNLSSEVLAYRHVLMTGGAARPNEETAVI
jgi:hypothetical protein